MENSITYWKSHLTEEQTQQLDSLAEKAEGRLPGLELTCTVCLSTFERPLLARCQHIFCESCFTFWHSEHHNCPTCRVRLPRQGAAEPFRMLQKVIDGLVQSALNPPPAESEPVLQIAHQQQEAPVEDPVLTRWERSEAQPHFFRNLMMN